MKTRATLRRLFFLTTLCFSLTLARAQYVPITDAPFGTWLSTNGYSSCLTGNASTGWQLDTTCNAVRTATQLALPVGSIADASALQYFVNLTDLSFSNNYIYNLPNLYRLIHLRRITAYSAHLTYLPVLPDSLEELECSYNSIHIINALPPRLTRLSCRNNPLTVLTNMSPTIRYLDCSYDSLPAIGTLPDSLVYLYASYNQLASLPALPIALTDLYVDNNNLTALPVLPSHLKEFYCQYNSVTSMPTLPSTLSYLDCGVNRLTSLPTLPAGLDTLDVSWNSLHSLPALPNLKFLGCDENPLYSLPALPASLRFLSCTSDSLTSLPTLPQSLMFLDCSINQLSGVFQPLPASTVDFRCWQNNLSSFASLSQSLTVFNCSSNNITSLPALPAALTTLYCYSNQINNLPLLPPALKKLNCAFNPSLSCLPRIYQNNLDVFYIAGTGITCLPNKFSATYAGSSWSNPSLYPLCTPASGCDFYYNIAGSIHMDTAASCQADSLLLGTSVKNVKVQLKQNGNVIQQFYTFSSGGYSFKAPVPGSYTVALDSTIPLAVACPASGMRTVSLTLSDSVKKYEHLGLQCGAADFAMLSISPTGRLRPGFNTILYIAGGNMAMMQHEVNCNTPVSGTVTTTLDSMMTYIGPGPVSIAPSSVAGKTLTYNIPDLNTLNYGSLNVMVSVDSSGVGHSHACISTTIAPAVPDINTSNNSFSDCFRIVNSLDPNYKDVSPETLHTTTGDWLTYTIHFQNTGSDTAYLVVLRDTLSAGVDAASFQYLASSHHAVIQLDHDAMTFTFPHINLVDSATNPALSEGWIQYRVRANSNLPNGTAINNTAYIYFDLNPAVVTNTATTTVQLTTCVDGDIYDTATICQGDTLYYGGMAMTATGFYYNLMQNATGCDTTYHIWLTALPPSRSAISDTICTGGTYSFGGDVLSSAGTYYDTLQSVRGCDSIIQLALATRPNDYLLIYDTICSGGQYIYLHDTLTASDSAIYIFQNAMGCDSFVQLILTVRPAPVVGFELQTLAANHDIYAVGSSDTIWCQYFRPTFAMKGGYPAGGHYSGLYIADDTFRIPQPHGYPQYAFTTDTMSYTFTDSNGCSSTATRYMHLDFCGGIKDIGLSTIYLYPDPNTGSFTLATERSYGLSYHISDILGKEIQQGTITSDTQPVQLPDVADGVYTIAVDGARPLRFVVVR